MEQTTPWTTEPDEVIWESEVGYTCVVRRHDRMKHLCGYVELPDDHPLWLSRPDLVHQLYVHGGVTWEGGIVPGRKSQAIGFDCAHAGDLSPGITEARKMAKMETPDFLDEEIYRDIEYVKNQCESLARQCLPENILVEKLIGD